MQSVKSFVDSGNNGLDGVSSNSKHTLPAILSMNSTAHRSSHDKSWRTQKVSQYSLSSKQDSCFQRGLGVVSSLLNLMMVVRISHF